MFLGRWITGIHGADRLVELRSELDQKDLALASGVDPSRRYIAYAPWMSAAQLRSEEPERPCPLSSENVTGTPRVVCQGADLESLNQYLMRGRYTGFQIIGSANDSNMRVERADDPWLSLTREMAPAMLRIVESVEESWAARARSLCQLVIPIGAVQPDRARRQVGRGFSSHLFRGAIFLDPPASDEHRIEAYAINFAHELGHQALFVYQCADPIIDGALDAPVYSVIRRVPRPAILSFHAVVAAAYMAEFVGDWLDAGAESTARLHYLRRRLAENVELVENGAAALSVVQFTELGEQILDEMRGLVAYLRIRHAIQ